MFIELFFSNVTFFYSIFFQWFSPKFKEIYSSVELLKLSIITLVFKDLFKDIVGQKYEVIC